MVSFEGHAAMGPQSGRVFLVESHLLAGLCGYNNQSRPYNFIHLPWKQLAVVNFMTHVARQHDYAPPFF